MRRGPVLLAVLWLAAAVVATAVGLLSVRLVAGQVGDGGTTALDATAVRDSLASASPSPTVTPRASTSPTASPSPTPKASRSASPRPAATRTATARATRSPQPRQDVGPVRTITTEGGTVSARCVDREPRLVYVTPADGFRTDEARNDRVRFEGDEREVEVELWCSEANTLQAQVNSDEESSGHG